MNNPATLTLIPDYLGQTLASLRKLDGVSAHIEYDTMSAYDNDGTHIIARVPAPLLPAALLCNARDAKGRDVHPYDVRSYSDSTDKCVRFYEV
jgi:hypothetical protein